LCYQPYGLPMLGFYVLVLPAMPLLLALFKRSKVAAAVLSFGLYVATQMIPGLQLPRFPWGREWLFNPMAWQFLFFLGMAIGTSSPQSRSRPAFRAILLALSLAILAGSLLIRKGWLDVVPGLGGLEGRITEFATAWSGKTRLEPLRIVHFACLAYALSRLLPGANAKVWHSKLAEPLVRCGQHSLAVYAFGVVLMFLSIPAFQLLGQSPEAVLMIDLDCCVLSVALAYLLSWRETRRRVRETV
jgi:hypothetical protein